MYLSIHISILKPILSGYITIRLGTKKLTKKNHKKKWRKKKFGDFVKKLKYATRDLARATKLG